MLEISSLLKDNMLDYSAAVNQSRAIPDARTGMKPIHRKILYEMYADKIKSTGKYKKCAYMVGQIIARFSEHGDAATYDALVRLAQPWIQRYPLLDFHGNYGSPFGDSQAAMRYTEAKLSPLVEEGMLYGLNKENVDWIPNFTNEEMEPSTLPAVFPGLFCLPNQGIGYAIACNFLTYNLDEVGEAIKAYIRTSELPQLQYDLASGGTIINPQIMDQIHKTGKGTVIVESKYEIDDNTITISELPFNVMFDDVFDEIVKLYNNDEINGISNIINNSGNNKMELVIECVDGIDPQNVMNVLMEKTKLRNSYSINQIALVDNKPKLLSTEDMIKIYIKHNCECIKREHMFDLERARKRIHILDGLLIAIGNIDDVIKIIRHDKTPSQTLKEQYNLDDEQVKAILDMKLARLSKLEVDKIRDELQEKKEVVNYCGKVVMSEVEQKKILIDRLTSLCKKYFSPRRTKIMKKEIVKSTSKVSKEKKEQTPIEVLVIANKDAYLKVVPVSNFRATKDVIINCFKSDTMSFINVFTNQGRMFRIKLSSINLCGPADKGTAIGSLVQLQKGEKILSVQPQQNDDKDYYIFTTKNGLVKKTKTSEYNGNVQNLKGLKAMGVKENDEIISISLGTDIENILITTKNGFCIRVASDDFNYQGKTAGGVKGISLRDGDCVVSSICCNEDDMFAVIGYYGNCKLVDQAEFNIQGRGGKGSKVSGEPISKLLQVKTNDTLHLVTSSGTMSLSVTKIPVMHRYDHGETFCKKEILDVIL